MTANGKQKNNNFKGFTFTKNVKKSSKNARKSYEEAYSESIDRFEKSPDRQHFVEADDPALMRLVELWGGNLYNAIQKPNIPGKTWTTLPYALEPRVLQERYYHEEHSVGLRFTGCTQILGIDTDRISSIHPEADETAYRRMIGVIEDLGLSKYTTFRSSYSNGLHLIFCLPEPVPSRLLSLAVNVALTNAGFTIKNGTLEVFPNLKGYNPDPKHIILYQGLRLPLQPGSGSYVLDNLDFEPLHNDLPTLIDQLQQDAQGQDMEVLDRAMKAAYDDYYVTVEGQLKPFRQTNSRQKAAAFEADLQRVEAQGWKGYGQTNDLIPVAVKLSYIFKGLDGEGLVRATAARMRELQGYLQYCRHQHNLEQRIRDWLKSIKALGYYPYRPGEYHPRQGLNYGDVVAATNAPPPDGRQHNAANAERQSAANRKFFDTIKSLIGEIRRGDRQDLPGSFRGWLDLIISTAKEKFGEGFGKTYLQKFKRTIERLARWASWMFHRHTPIMPTEATTYESSPLSSSTICVEPEPDATTDDIETTGYAVLAAAPPVENPETRLAPAVTGYFEKSSKNEAVENSETRLAPAVTGNPPIYVGGGCDIIPPSSYQHFSYRQGQQVRFQHESFQGWRKGIVEWVDWQSGYFVNCLIRFRVFVTRSRYQPGQWEDRIVKIFNVNWLQPLTSEPP